jgi:ABC-2 type transport system ATP-binding protein
MIRKSTTIKLLLVDPPDSGQCVGLGEDIGRAASLFASGLISAQDQRFYEYMTARQTLRYVARFFYHGPKKLIEDRK